MLLIQKIAQAFLVRVSHGLLFEILTSSSFRHGQEGEVDNETRDIHNVVGFLASWLFYGALATTISFAVCVLLPFGSLDDRLKQQFDEGRARMRARYRSHLSTVR